MACPKCKGDFAFLPATKSFKCSYCGDEIQFVSTSSTECSIPDLIIPFSKTKTEAAKQFCAQLADDDLVPDDIFDETTTIVVSAMYCPAYYCTGRYEGNWSALSIVKCDVKQGDKSHTAEQAAPISGVVKDRFWHIQMASRLCKEIGTSATGGDFMNRFIPFQAAVIEGYQVENFAKAHTQDECESQLRLLANALAAMKAKEMVPTSEAKNFAVNVDVNCQLSACLVPVWLCEINSRGSTYRLWLSGHATDTEITGDLPQDARIRRLSEQMKTAGKGLFGVAALFCGATLLSPLAGLFIKAEDLKDGPPPYVISIACAVIAITLLAMGFREKQSSEKRFKETVGKSKEKRRSKMLVVS